LPKTKRAQKCDIIIHVSSYSSKSNRVGVAQ